MWEYQKHSHSARFVVVSIRRTRCYLRICLPLFLNCWLGTGRKKRTLSLCFLSMSRSEKHVVRKRHESSGFFSNSPSSLLFFCGSLSLHSVFSSQTSLKLEISENSRTLEYNPFFSTCYILLEWLGKCLVVRSAIIRSFKPRNNPSLLWGI